MSHSAVSIFLSSVSRDPSLAEEFDHLLASGEDRAVPAEQVVEMARSKGYRFTTRELKAFLATGMSLEAMETFRHAPEAYGQLNINVEIDGIAFEVEPDGYILFT